MDVERCKSGGADWEEEGTKAAVGDTLAFPNQQLQPDEKKVKKEEKITC